MTEEAARERPQAGIDVTFRNASIAAVGIILGFVLGWAAEPIAWSLLDIAAAVAINLGLVLPGKPSPTCSRPRRCWARNGNLAHAVPRWPSHVAAGITVALLLDSVG